MITPPTKLDEFSALLEIVKALRGEQGCPWDKEQTHASLAPFAIEEAHELAEAIELNDRSEMISELGDLLLQVALHSEVARQENNFDVSDVLKAINEKMVRRHPHVFALESAKDSEEVLKNWAEIKRKEKAAKTHKQQSKFDVPPGLPALMRAQKIGNKTQEANFDWSNSTEVIAKIEEELAELKTAIAEQENNKMEQENNKMEQGNDTDRGGGKLGSKVEDELGDLLFSTAQLARHLKCDAEQSLRTANRRFEKRFFKMFEIAQQRGLKPDRGGLEKLWGEVKVLEKAGKI